MSIHTIIKGHIPVGSESPPSGHGVDGWVRIGPDQTASYDSARLDSGDNHAVRVHLSKSELIYGSSVDIQTGKPYEQGVHFIGFVVMDGIIHAAQGEFYRSGQRQGALFLDALSQTPPNVLGE